MGNGKPKIRKENKKQKCCIRCKEQNVYRARMGYPVMRLGDRGLCFSCYQIEMSAPENQTAKITVRKQLEIDGLI